MTIFFHRSQMRPCQRTLLTTIPYQRNALYTLIHNPIHSLLSILPFKLGHTHVRTFIGLSHFFRNKVNPHSSIAQDTPSQQHVDNSTMVRKPLNIFDLFDKYTLGAQKLFYFDHAASGLGKKAPSYPFPNPLHLPRHLSTLLPGSQLPDDIESVSEQFLLSKSCGEDAYFHSKSCLAVADGVGGWASVKGADPALYSSLIMHYVAVQAQRLEQRIYVDMADMDQQQETVPEHLEPSSSEILSNSYKTVKTIEESSQLVGSTTALVSLLWNDELLVTNIGDCGLMVIRNFEPIFRSEEQQHSFNFPFQLGTGSRDTPSSAQNFNIKLKENDIVIVASDGVWDNLFDEDIVQIVKECAAKVLKGQNTRPRSRLPLNVQNIADTIITRARTVAENTKCSSPFQTRAIHEGLYYQGGKLDDMSVIVGIVRLQEDSPDRR